MRDRHTRRFHHDEGPRGRRFHRGEGRGPRGEERGPRGERREFRGGGRARRGEARFLLLDALRESPRHGYEIIRALEERSGGEYTPSPGTVYPTLQYLEDLGYIKAEQEGERRVFHLTDAGRAELEAHAEEIRTFWERVEGPAASTAQRAEIGFLRCEVQSLIHTIRSSIHQGGLRDRPWVIRQLRQALQRCHDEVRNLIADQQPSQ